MNILELAKQKQDSIDDKRLKIIKEREEEEQKERNDCNIFFEKTLKILKELEIDAVSPNNYWEGINISLTKDIDIKIGVISSSYITIRSYLKEFHYNYDVETNFVYIKPNAEGFIDESNKRIIQYSAEFLEKVFKKLISDYN
jgi:hypothetical protein